MENAGEDDQNGIGEDGEAEGHRDEGQEVQPGEAQEEIAEDEGQEENAMDAEEEAERPRGLRDPGRPSKSEIEEHEITHIPFRPWCRACVLGRAKGKLHMRLVGTYANSGVPRVRMDYCYITEMNHEGADENQPENAQNNEERG